MKELIQIARHIKEADAILIGASNGLSIAEGLHLFADNQAFEELFGDFKRKYGLRCILHGLGGSWPCEEEKWAFISHLVQHYCGEYEMTSVMSDLKAIVGDKEYFIVTSNGESHFELSGFLKEKIYEIEGDWLTMQCANACHSQLYPTLELTRELLSKEQDGKIPTECVPRCPNCGGCMQLHVEIDYNFIPNVASRIRYEEFLKKYHGKKLVILELGIGWRNQLIKAPFMQLTANEPNATYVTINLGEVYITPDIENKSYGLDGSLDTILHDLQKVVME